MSDRGFMLEKRVLAKCRTIFCLDGIFAGQKSRNLMRIFARLRGLLRLGQSFSQLIFFLIGNTGVLACIEGTFLHEFDCVVVDS